MAELSIQRSVLVTGAAGCIGTALTRRLSRTGFHVQALVRDRRQAGHLLDYGGVDLIEGDLDSIDLLNEAVSGCDLVYHAAARVHAPSGTPETEFTRANVDGTRHLVEAAVKNGVRSFVFFSTVAVYPEKDDVQDELSHTEPHTPYGASKLAAEGLVLKAGIESGLKSTVLRLPVVYGPRDRGNVAKLIQAIRNGSFFIVGNGENLKSMIAVGNVVDAAMLAVDEEKARGEIYNVCDSRPYSQREIAETIAELLGRSKNFFTLPLFWVHNAGRLADTVNAITGISLPLTADLVRKLAANTIFSSAKIERELGFKPRISLREGLEEVITKEEEERQITKQTK